MISVYQIVLTNGKTGVEAVSNLEARNLQDAVERAYEDVEEPKDWYVTSKARLGSAD